MSLLANTKAPNFQGNDQDGNLIRLEDYKGKKLILYFYPKDNTPGCTAESCNLRDNYEALLEKGFAIIGVSADTERKHRNFISKYNLPFPLLADVDKEVCKAFDVWHPKKIFGKEFLGIVRTTYIIENGMITHVFEKVNTDNHTEQILKELEK